MELFRFLKWQWNRWEWSEKYEQNITVWRDVFKDPITDSGKKSKRGRVTLWKCGSEYESAVYKPTRWVDDGIEWTEAMETYFEDGQTVFSQTVEEVRANSNL